MKPGIEINVIGNGIPDPARIRLIVEGSGGMSPPVPLGGDSGVGTDGVDRMFLISGELIVPYLGIRARQARSQSIPEIVGDQVVHQGIPIGGGNCDAVPVQGAVILVDIVLIGLGQ